MLSPSKDRVRAGCREPGNQAREQLPIMSLIGQFGVERYAGRACEENGEPSEVLMESYGLSSCVKSLRTRRRNEIMTAVRHQTESVRARLTDSENLYGDPARS